MSEVLKKAEIQYKAGNFLSAKSLYEQLQNERPDLRIQTHSENRIIECTKLHGEVFSSSGIGEAQFPLYDEKEKIASLVTLKTKRIIAKEQIVQDIENVYNAVCLFLTSLVEQHSNRFCILDWRIRDLKLCIKPVSINHTVTGEMRGRSFELAAAMAIISFILHKNIDPLNVFTGKLESDSDSVNISAVDSYRDKLNSSRIERPGLKNFIVPNGSGIGEEAEVFECSNLQQAVLSVFPDAINDLLSKLESWPAKTNAIEFPKFIRWMKGTGVITASADDTLYNTEVKIYKVEHPDLIYSDLKRAFSFLKEQLAKEIKDSDSAVVIDGIAPNFLTAVLLSSDYLRNPLNVKFISILKRADDKVVISEKYGKIDKSTEAVIVRYDNRKQSEGEVFYFKRN